MSSARIDGRSPKDLRSLSCTWDIAPQAVGSVLLKCGKTEVICTASVDEAVPRWMKEQGVAGGWLTAEYSMLPRSTHTRSQRESTRGKVGGRTHEIQRLIGRSLRAALDLSRLGPRTIYIDCDVIQADGGTRTAAITGGYVALALAVNHIASVRRLSRPPLRTQIAAVSAGIVAGEPLLDLAYTEDSRAEVDFNVVMTGDGEFIEVQGTAEGKPFSRARLDTILDLAGTGLQSLFDLQRKAIATDRQ
ncbi:MAG: ribonuclease PH [Proteobacteria bacterium]|nr:ribonuclease PH [Pseudomonadota bacterium]